MSYPVYLQANFGAAKTNVKWQLYDHTALIGTASTTGVTAHPITGIYSALIDITDSIGVQWTCTEGDVRQQDLTLFVSFSGVKALLDSVSSNLSLQSNILDKVNFMIESDGGAGWQWSAASMDQVIGALPVMEDDLLDLPNGVETGITVRQALRAQLSALAGKLSGAETTEIRIRDVNDTKDRIIATVDEPGNRTAVTLDLD
jgi:hypothetical protein